MKLYWLIIFFLTYGMAVSSELVEESQAKSTSLKFFSEIYLTMVHAVNSGEKNSAVNDFYSLLKLSLDNNLQYKWSVNSLETGLERLLPLIESESSPIKKDIYDKLDEIIKQFKQQKNGHGYLMQAMIFDQQKEYEKAIKEIERGLKLLGTPVEKNYAIRMLLIDYRGRLKEKTGQYVDAYKDYTTSGDLTGILSLVLTNHYPVQEDEKNNLLKELQDMASKAPSEVPGFIYSTLQIARGNQESGIKILLQMNDLALMMRPLAKLQLGLAYYYGVGVEQNKIKAERYLDASEKPLTLSGSVATGYRLFYGIGKEKDEKAALPYFSDPSVFDDLPLPFELLFPDIAQVIRSKAEEERKNAAEWLLAAEEKEVRVKKTKRTGKTKQSEKKEISEKIEPQASSSTTGESHRELLPQESAQSINWEIILGTPDVWNNSFQVKDDSRVSGIDYNQKIITVNDVKNNEQLLFYVKCDPNEKRRFIPPFKYHQRILLRQDLSQSDVNEKTAYDHSFAQMLDYVIQQFGTLAPLLKAGGQIDDQLVADVVRIDAQGNKKPCHAEYTFGKKGKEVYVYHRLLRPMKDKNSPLQCPVPSSSKSVR